MMNGTATFRLEKSNFIFGLVCIACTTTFVILAILNTPNFGVWFSLMIPCLFFSLLSLVPCIVMRVRIDNCGIEYRGVKKTYIKWQSADYIFIRKKRKSAVIYGNGNRIAVGTEFGGFGQMLKLIEQYAQVDIGNDAALKQKEISDTMRKTFRKSKFLVIFGCILLTLAIVLVSSNYKPEKPLETLLLAIAGAVLSFYFLQAYYFDKVYIDSHRIVRSSLLRGKVEIRWDDIQSVSNRFVQKIRTLTILSNDDLKISVTSEFKEFYDIEQFVAKYSPVKPVDDDE